MRTVIEWIRMNAPVVQALAAVMSVVVAAVLCFVAWQQRTIAQVQAQAGRLNALRDIIRQHHSSEMRKLRKLVRHDLVQWLASGKPRSDENEDWVALKTAYEDTLNYYEYLGSLLRDKLADEDIILRICHNSAVAIWNIHDAHGDKVRPRETRAKDYAGEFAYLVERAREYRRIHGLEG